MNILKIFSDLKGIITADNLKFIYEAYNIFKKKDVMNKGFNDIVPEIDSVLQKLNMGRQDLSKLLPLLNQPKVRGTLERVMPNSVGNLESLVDYLGGSPNNNINNNNNNINNNNNNNISNNINNNHNNNSFRFPKLS